MGVVFASWLSDLAKNPILVFRCASSGKPHQITGSLSYATQTLTSPITPWPALKNAFNMLKNWV